MPNPRKQQINRWTVRLLAEQYLRELARCGFKLEPVQQR